MRCLRSQAAASCIWEDTQCTANFVVRVSPRASCRRWLVLLVPAFSVYSSCFRNWVDDWAKRKLDVPTMSMALILLFGPAPVLTLLALSDEPKCQMACCKRKGFARSCAVHHSQSGASSGPGLLSRSN